MFYFHLLEINIVWNNCPTILYCSLMPTSPPPGELLCCHRHGGLTNLVLLSGRISQQGNQPESLRPRHLRLQPEHQGSYRSLRRHWSEFRVCPSLFKTFILFCYLNMSLRSFWSIKIKSIISCLFQDDQTGLIHLQDSHRKSVYDPFLGSFLTPDWSNLHKYIHQPERFLLYRINGNDPLNSPKRAGQSGNITVWIFTVKAQQH